MNKLTALAAVVALSVGLAACGGGGGTAMMMPERSAQEMCEADGGTYADGNCMTAAQVEATAIANAIAAARTAVEGLTGESSDADVAAANAAIMEAHSAIEAAEHASPADTVANVAALGAVRTSLMTARTTITNYRANVESMALAAAKMKASEAAMAARMKATEARTAAARVAEILGAETESAMAADAAADAAEAAATAAEAASMRAQEDTMSSDAEAEQQTAEAEQGKAETQFAAADELRRQAQQFADNNERRDLGNARDDAKMYADMAAEHYEAAKGKAADARVQANAARAAANKAMAARTNYANADKYADMAEAAATAAEAARDMAEMAKNAAMAAYNAAMAATTAEAAQAEAAKAKAQNAIATAQHTGDDGAGMKYMAAKDAAMKAEMAADVHVLGLLKAANAVSETDTDDRTATITAVATAVAAAAGSATDADNDGATASGGGDDGVTVTWVANTPDDPDTMDNEFVAGLPVVTITGVGADSIVSETRASDDEASPAIVNNAATIAGMSDFMHGFDISTRGTDGTTDGRHVIVFTDIEQAKAAAEAVTLGEAVNIENKPVTASQIVLADGATTLTGATYDHDGNPDTNGLTATLACGSAQATDCSYEITGGELTSLVGYVIDVTAAATFVLTAATPEVPDATYLAFGVWLNEDGDATTDGNQPQVGAFSGGVSPVTADTYGGAVVTGPATYNGKAAGVYTQGSSVDYFQADATLTANFGAIDTDAEEGTDPPADTALGTITGRIHNIVAGGVLTGDVIRLNDDLTPDDGNITATGAITGEARMGTATTVDAVTTYTHNGSWSGQFYNGTADDDDTDAVNESHVAPGSVAGTFGVTGTVGEGAAAVTTSYVGAFGAHK
ncbi:MAG: hypothetical protein OXQ29_03310 [Rhodospirillaceae bacterium]|nr:hypothetical protein [Rhodospirillaceae bacterium]